MALLPERIVCGKASGLEMVRQYRSERCFLPSPLVGEGGTDEVRDG
jgi:hypothetical protein